MGDQICIRRNRNKEVVGEDRRDKEGEEGEEIGDRG
jgi:hypothetical protein